MNKKAIKNFSLEELDIYFISIGEKKFRAQQLFDALYKKKINNFNQISSFSKKLQDKLEEDFELYSLNIVSIQNSIDGSKKILFKTHDANFIETVFLPNSLNSNSEINTICISTMVGCPLNCKFCATARLGYKRNLEQAEILDQILLTQNSFGAKVDNIVIMGMGEPLLNYSNTISALKLIISEKIVNKRSITLSTVGIPEKIIQLADSGLKIKIAWSLHATYDNIRKTLIPVAANYTIENTCKALDYYYNKTKLPITIEYILLKNINNSFEDIKKLTKIARRFPSKVNIIPFNNIDFIDDKTDLVAANQYEIEEFGDALRSNGVMTITRKSQGQDISAACGQLAATVSL